MITHHMKNYATRLFLTFCKFDNLGFTGVMFVSVFHVFEIIRELKYTFVIVRLQFSNKNNISTTKPESPEYPHFLLWQRIHNILEN